MEELKGLEKAFVMLTVLTGAFSGLRHTGAADVIISGGAADRFQGWGGASSYSPSSWNLDSSHFLFRACCSLSVLLTLACTFVE